MNISDIKLQLKKSCIDNNPKDFIPYLVSKKVKVNMPNKTRFYTFFKYMINCAKQNTIGKWTLKIENTSWNNGKETLAYNFYDEKHKYARLSLMITENKDEILIETMPF